MARVGEIKRENPGLSTIWTRCPKCKKERWVFVSNTRGNGFTSLCRDCWKSIQIGKGERSWNWRGGRRKSSKGYVGIYIYPDDPLYPMAMKAPYIYEHRLVIARMLGRCLKKGEIVHHLNGIRDDNRLENLELMPDRKHRRLLMARAKRIQQLEALLRGQGQLC